MTSETLKWIEAGKILGRDPDAKVRCPHCGDEYLQVQDVVNPEDPNEFERVLTCPGCNASNSLLMKKPSSGSE